MTDWKSYTGEFSFQGTDELFSTQYKNKPEPPKHKPNPKYAPDAQKAGLGICNNPHCEVCKKPVENEPHGGFCGDVGCSICANFRKPNKPITGMHYTSLITDDLTEDAQMARCNYACRKCNDPNCAIRNKATKEDHVNKCGDPDCPICGGGQKSKKEVKMDEDEPKDFEYQQLYEVTTTYGVDRDKVVVKRTDVVAENDKRALMQSKDDIDPEWDMDYVEQHVNMLCAVRVKRKPREVLKG